MANKQRRVKGSILEIKLGNGKYCYAQDLDVDIMFIDICLDTPLEQLDILTSKEPLFFVGVYNDVITQGRWNKVGKLPIKSEYQIVPMKFIQDALDPNSFELYNPNTGEITKSTRGECEGLERAAVWEGSHVEDRLKDHFDGISNVWVEQLKIK